MEFKISEFKDLAVFLRSHEVKWNLEVSFVSIGLQNIESEHDFVDNTVSELQGTSN